MKELIEMIFKDGGKWADNPADPIFTVGAGESKMVSANLASVLIKSGKGYAADSNKPSDDEVTKINPAQDDKGRADKGHTSKGRVKGSLKGGK